jgi:hypothetical protein
MSCKNFKYCDVGAAGAAGFVGADLCVCPSYPASAPVLPERGTGQDGQTHRSAPTTTSQHLNFP